VFGKKGKEKKEKRKEERGTLIYHGPIAKSKEKKKEREKRGEEREGETNRFSFNHEQQEKGGERRIDSRTKRKGEGKGRGVIVPMTKTLGKKEGRGVIYTQKKGESLPAEKRKGKGRNVYAAMRRRLRKGEKKKGRPRPCLSGREKKEGTDLLNRRIDERDFAIGRKEEKEGGRATRYGSRKKEREKRRSWTLPSRRAPQGKRGNDQRDVPDTHTAHYRLEKEEESDLVRKERGKREMFFCPIG